MPFSAPTTQKEATVDQMLDANAKHSVETPPETPVFKEPASPAEVAWVATAGLLVAAAVVVAAVGYWREYRRGKSHRCEL